MKHSRLRMIRYISWGGLLAAALLVAIGCTSPVKIMGQVAAYSSFPMEESEVMFRFPAILERIAGEREAQLATRLGELLDGTDAPLQPLFALEALALSLRLEYGAARTPQVLERSSAAREWAPGETSAALLGQYLALAQERVALHEAWSKERASFQKQLRSGKAREGKLSQQVKSLQQQIEELKQIEMILDERKAPEEGGR